MPTAAEAGLAACHCCGLLSRRPPPGVKARCPRCRAPLTVRKAESLARTWAFLIAAVILYFPANLLPVMQTSSMFGSSQDTIMSGVVYFWRSGSEGLAALIFFVSVVIPLAKIATLSVLAVSVQCRRQGNFRRRAVLFRVVEFVGRWSMLDVFVVALMVGLVRFGQFAVIEAGPGAAAFGAVVVLTILAARSFDPRLMWDHA